MNPWLFHVLDLLAKSAGIVLLAFATQSLWRSASAAQRSAVWLAAFCALLLLPFTRLWQPHWSMALSQPSTAVTLPEVTRGITLPSSNLTLQAAQPDAQDWLPRLSAAQWLALVWLTGLVCILSRRLLGSLQLRRLKSQSRPAQGERVLACTSRVAAALGVRRSVELRMSSSVAVPLTWGCTHPVLLLPAAAVEWEEARLEAALRHELGHIRHWDALTRLITTFVTAVYWPNVLVWLGAKAWRTVQEQAADDVVMRSGTVAENYALQLLEAARGIHSAGGLRAPVLAMAQPSTLETRLSAIMDGGRNRRSCSLRGVATALAFAAGMLALSAAAQLRAADEKPGQTAAAAAAGGLKAKAQKLIVAKMILKAASLEQAVAFLRDEAKILDPDHAGLNITIKDPGYHGDAEISLDLRNVPVAEALHYVASLSDRVVLYEPHGIIISPKTAEGQQVTRSYKLPAGALAKIGNAREWLASQGIGFEEGATAAVVAEGSRLLVKNTPEQHDLVEAIVSRITAGGVVAPAVAAPPAMPLSGLEKKAAGIVFPTVHFQQATLTEALELLREKAKEFDPDKKGVSILIRAEDVPQNARISLDLKNVPLTEALRYTAGLAGMSLVAEPYAFILKPQTSGR